MKIIEVTLQNGEMMALDARRICSIEGIKSRQATVLYQCAANECREIRTRTTTAEVIDAWKNA